jgi:hypothetical protein
MKTKKLKIAAFFSLISIFIVNILMAEEYKFKVLIKNGDVKFITQNERKIHELKPGTNLYENDKIIAKGSVYICLAHKDDLILELSQSGIYKVIDLENKLGNNKNKFVSKYIDFLIEAMKEESDINEKFKLGVERNLHYKEDIITLMPKNIKYYGEDIRFIWFSKPNAEEYSLTVKDKFSEEIFTTKTADTMKIINLAEAGLKQGNWYIWNVMISADKNSRSKDSYLYILNEEEADIIRKDVENINSCIYGSNGIITDLLIAQYYESKNMMLNAYECYEKLKRNNINTEEFKNIYNNFLFKLREE